MIHGWRGLALTTLAWGALVLPGHAQILGTGVIPVTEVGPQLAQSTITAAQSVITAVQSVLQVKNQLLDLLPVDEVILAATWAEDMAELLAIMSSAQELAADVGSVRAQLIALFNLETAPNNTTALAQRQYDIRRQVTLAYCYAMETQTLIRTLLHTMEHLTSLVSQISAFVGAKQGAQTLAQLSSSLNQTLMVLTVQNAAYQRAESLDRSTEPLVVESLTRINTATMANWPK